MDIEYKGANCVLITTKKSGVVIDPKLSTVGLKDIMPKNSVVIATQADLLVDGSSEDSVMIDRPGEYEVRDVSIVGSPAARMIDHDNSLKATVYRVVVGDVRFAVLGHIAAPLTEEQLEALGVIDVAIVPVGGSGYTLDAHQAVSVVRQIDPKVVIPTHYADKAINYEVPQMDLEPFVKELSAPQHETVAKWKIKGPLPEILTLMQIERTA
jgi:L-ascorbate metabolism protein UlaG (beta-lactamase superfamily)